MNESKGKKRTYISAKKAALFSVLLICLLLLVGETVVRVWAYYFRTSFERYNSDSGRLELVPNTHIIDANGNEFLVNSKGFAGPEFKEHRSKGVYRIFALGDSCTIGYWKYVYPALLKQLLNSQSSHERFEVINAGIAGYNSQNARDRLIEDILQYKPDMVTIYIGWNDLMKVNPNNLSATGRYTWLARLMEQSYLMKVYRKLIFYYLRPLVMKPKSSGNELDVYVFDHFVPLTYQENLETMIQILQKRGIQALLMTLPTVVRPGMNYEEIKRQRVVFPYYAGAYSVDKFLSLHRSYNHTIRRTASKHAVPILDLDTIFNKYDKNYLFWDTMHPSPEGHRLIGQSLLYKIHQLVESRKE